MGGARPDLVTMEQAANFVKVHPTTVRNWIKRGVIKKYQMPGDRACVRVDLNEILTKMEEGGM